MDHSLMAMLPVLKTVQNSLLRFYQQQQQQEQLLLRQQQQEQQQQQINHQAQQHYINENQNYDDEELDNTNSKPHLSFPLLLHTLFSAIN